MNKKRIKDEKNAIPDLKELTAYRKDKRNVN